MKTGNISGKRIKERRRAQKLAQVDLAAALAVEYDLDISQADISKIEHNQRILRDYELRAIAQVLEVSMDALANNDGDLMSEPL
ncbi:MAG: helix-turn-helix transcriptional regulator [Cyanobacteria bacterium P01_C01_bin.120]